MEQLFQNIPDKESLLLTINKRMKMLELANNLKHFDLSYKFGTELEVIKGDEHVKVFVDNNFNYHVLTKDNEKKCKSSDEVIKMFA